MENGKTKTQNGGGTKASPIQISREKLNLVLQKLNQLVIGHEEVNKMLLVSLIAHEHAVMISPPGCAKSYTIEMLSKLINAKFYKYLLTRFTTDIEVLGVYNVKKIVEEGKLVREWTSIKDAEIVFLDEIFKANSAILNSLLSLLQERILYDPFSGTAVKTNVISVFGASNEIPSEEELQALYDRFAVRIFIKYLDDDTAILRALEARWLNSNGVKPVASIEDVKTLHNFAIQLIKSELVGLGKFINIYHVNAIPFIKSLRAKGIVVSDRTIIEKLPKLLASYCALFGVTLDNLINGILDILPYLGKDANESEAIKKAVFEDLGEVAQLHEKLNKAKIAIKSANLSEAEKLLHEIINFDMNVIAKKPWLKSRVETIIAEAKATLDKVIQIKKTLEEMAGNTGE